MASVLKPDLNDTALHGFPHRRVWHAPVVRSHSLAVLTATRLYLTPPAGRPKPEILTAIETGADLDAVLDPLATVVELSAVRRATLDLLTNTLRLEYASAGRPMQAVVGFASAESADALFTKVWRRLGDRFELTPHKPDPWVAARVPVAIMLGVLAATIVLALAASAADDLAGARAGSHPSPLVAALGRMDWRMVCGVGGAVLAIVQAWLYRRLTRPPARLELVRR